MMFKVVFMICISLSMGLSIISDESDLEAIMKAVEGRINSLVGQTTFVLKTFSTSITYNGNEAKAQYLFNLTRAAEAYWTYVEEAESKAAETGQNIDSCVIEGSSQLYILNNSFVSNANRNIDGLVSNAQTKLDSYYVLARDEPLHRLTELWVEVRACHNDECADELEREINTVYDELENDINTATREAEQFALVEYVDDLSTYTFEPKVYSTLLNNVIEGVKTCIEVV